MRVLIPFQRFQLPSVSIDNIKVTKKSLTITEGSIIAVELGSNISVRGTNPLLINYEVSMSGDFFETISNGTTTIDIEAGTKNSQIQFNTIADEEEEVNGFLNITLLSGNGYYLASSRASDNAVEITIEDDDPTLSISSLTKEEGTGGENIMQFEVTISSAPLEDVKVEFATESVSATQDIDFTEAIGTLTFPANETASKFISVVINPDNIDEEDEEFNLTLTTPTGGVKIGGTGFAIGTIEDDDDAPTLSISSAEIKEGQFGESDMTFVALLTHPSSRVVTFKYSTTEETATAGEDFISITNQDAEIPAGARSLPIKIKVVGDEIPEADEMFKIVLNIAANATISTTANIGTGTIVSDDQPAFHIVNASGLEDINGENGEITFEITLSPAHSVPATVQFALADDLTDSAISGIDFVAVDFTKEISFRTGERRKTVTVGLIKDDVDEEDEEFTVRLSGESGGTAIVGNGTAKGRIIDNDGEVDVSISDAELVEGNSGQNMMEFKVTLSTFSGREISLRYNTAEMSSGEAAVAGVDYESVIDGALIFLPGVTTRTISIPIFGDDEFESNEAFYVILAEATNANIDRNIGIGVIINDNDPEIPRLALELGQRDTFEEGDVVEIKVSAKFYSVGGEIDLPINITQTGEFIRWRHSKTLKVSSSEESFIRITTHNDNLEEDHGSITVSIAKMEGVFTVNPAKSSVTVMVRDNDGENLIQQPNIGIASTVANNLLEMATTS